VTAFVIHANLDCEAVWSGAPLPPAVARRISYYGALLAALAPEDAEVEVWAPAAVDPARLRSTGPWRAPAMRVGAPPRADLNAGLGVVHVTLHMALREVFENLSVAADPQDLRSYFLDLIWPVNPKLRPEVVRAITEFDLDQDLHRDVHDLSYGKRRLLAIARAVAMHPSVLLLDEPAAGLSSSESVELARVVRRLADDWGMAILVVEHDMNFVMGVCDQVIVLDFGKLISAGSPEHVRNDPAVVAAYLGTETDEQLEAESLDASESSPASVGGGAS